MSVGAIVDSATPAVPSERKLGLRAALLLSIIVALGLGALAFWPASAWVPPLRPVLKGPVVFDEFVTAPGPPAASSSIPDSAVH
jgi:hypothetical protein